MGYIAAIAGGIAGRSFRLPDRIASDWPELRRLRFRRGGLLPRIGGWFLGRRSVAAITVGRTVFVAPSTPLDPELLLHEFRHVQHFSERWSFPLSYIWESLRRGYHANRYEADARSYAAHRVGRGPVPDSEEDA